jgi:hypothetical protein
MPAETESAAERTFRELLTAAITAGRRPLLTAQLGPASWAAIDAVAREHPDATADHVVAAHDAFAFEVDDATCRDLDPMTSRAAEPAAIDTLVAQLAITYPDVDPQTLAAVVRRIHSDFDEHELRKFVPLFVEQAVHRHLA